MQIADNTVVSFDYVLKDDSGQVLDSSEGAQPLAYLHGAGGIIPGLERALVGKQAGDELQVAVAPEDAYGVRNEALRQAVPREQFGDIEELAVGDAVPRRFERRAVSGDRGGSRRHAGHG